MDLLRAFHDEVAGIEAAARSALDSPSAPSIPSCPGWTMNELLMHLGMVHRSLSHAIKNRTVSQPDFKDPGFLELPADTTGWPPPEPVPGTGPTRGPVPAGLVDWYAEGAAGLERLFRTADPADPVWSWSDDHTVGFWLRMQTIEAAVHRWDADDALGTARPVAAELATDAVTQTFEVMAPARRSWRQAPPGAGERYRFRRSDGPDVWTVHFDDDRVALRHDVGPPDERCDLEIAGTASDLMLFLWRRVPSDRLTLTGDREFLDRYFVLVPPV